MVEDEPTPDLETILLSRIEGYVADLHRRIDFLEQDLLHMAETVGSIRSYIRGE